MRNRASTLRRNSGVPTGFTLIELLVALLVGTAIIVGMLNLFDLANRTSLVQTEVAEMQQSHRIAQADLVRMARETARGMVPLGNLPGGLAVAVANEATSGALLAPGNAGSPTLVEGSDVVTLRGIFESPIYLVEFGDAGAVTVNGSPATDGVIRVDRVFDHGIIQDLAPLAAAITTAQGGGEPEALFVVGPRSDARYSIVELNGPASSISADEIQLAFRVTGGTRTAQYQALAPYPAGGMRNIAYLGILEEHRYFIEEEFRTAGDPSTPLAPRLGRGRFYPGTNIPHLNAAANLNIPIADNVFDLQAALGVDSGTAGALRDAIVVDNPTPIADDEWLYNDPNDDDTDVTKWVQGPTPSGNIERWPLYYLRVNTLVHTDRKLRNYFAEDLTAIEDRVGAGLDDFNATEEKRYRRRWLRSVVDFRNLY